MITWWCRKLQLRYCCCDAQQYQALHQTLQHALHQAWQHAAFIAEQVHACWGTLCMALTISQHSSMQHAFVDERFQA